MARKLAVVLAVALSAAWSGPALSDHVKDGRPLHRIVFQMNEDSPNLWSLMLNNINNLITEVGKDHVDIRVVTYGPGINMFRKDRSPLLERLESLKKFAGKVPKKVLVPYAGVSSKETPSNASTNGASAGAP